MIRHALACLLATCTPVPAFADETAAELKPADTLRFESSRSMWGSDCWLLVSQGGRTRIMGSERGPCIDALDEAVKLARNEELVNRGMRRKGKRP